MERSPGSRRVLPALIGVLGVAPAALAQAPSPGVEVAFMSPSAPGEVLRVQAKAPPGTEWVVLFHRRAGEIEFEALSLEPDTEGGFSAQPGEALPLGVPLQCYVASSLAGKVSTRPEQAPSEVFSLVLPAPEPSAGPAPPVVPPPSPSPVSLEASFTDLAHRRQPAPTESTLLAAGQVRYAVQQDLGEGQVSLGTRLVYANQPPPNQAHWSLGDLQASYTRGPHRLQAGDLMTQESEFTLGPAGRRGLDYTYSSQALGGHLFALNTERQSGLHGLLWPEVGSGAYGGSLSTRWFSQTLQTKLVFLTGRDDLAKGSNFVTAYAAPLREGSTGALLVDGRFLENRLGVSGEYARSLFTGDARVGLPKQTDQAWRLASQWAEGPFSAQAAYRAVGQAFGTVGVAFFVADRRVVEGSLSLNQARWGLSAMASEERTNPNGQVNLSQARNQSQGLDARLLLNPMLTWRVGLRAGRQAGGIVANPFVPFSDSERKGLSTGLDVSLPPRLLLSFNAQIDQLQATGFSSTRGTSRSLSLGGTLSLGDWARLSPNLAWSRSLSQPGDQQLTTANAFLNAQFSLIPGSLVLLLNGGGSSTVLATGETLRATTIEGTLGYTLDPHLWRQARGSFGLKARYTRNPSFLGIVEDDRLYLLLNLAF